MAARTGRMLALRGPGIACAALAVWAAPIVAARADVPVIAGGTPAPPASRTFTLDAAVAFATANHPAMRAAEARERAADGHVDEARAGELPDIGVSAQLNRSTGNVVPGTFFPTPGIPGVAGPPRGRALDS